MGQRPLFLSTVLILLLGFFSAQGSLTGNAVHSSSDLSYDLNHDGVVDSEDLHDVMELASYSTYSKEADFNHDGVVDQADVDLLAASLST